MAKYKYEVIRDLLMKTVDYDHIMQIVDRAAKANKSAQDVYLLLRFAFGEPNDKNTTLDKKRI